MINATNFNLPPGVSLWKSRRYPRSTSQTPLWSQTWDSWGCTQFTHPAFTTNVRGEAYVGTTEVARNKSLQTGSVSREDVCEISRREFERREEERKGEGMIGEDQPGSGSTDWLVSHLPAVGLTCKPQGVAFTVKCNKWYFVEHTRCKAARV